MQEINLKNLTKDYRSNEAYKTPPDQHRILRRRQAGHRIYQLHAGGRKEHRIPVSGGFPGRRRKEGAVH